MKRLLGISPLAGLCLLGACATVPPGPSVMALPATAKSFDQFRLDDADCRQYAQGQIGGTSPGEEATKSAVASAAIGTAVGALAGAAFDGHHGAGVGAGAGLLVGGLAGAGGAQASAGATQHRYDAAYVQCMYAKGNRVPLSGRMVSAPSQTRSPAPQRYAVPPPPPPGAPPPPQGNAPPPPPGSVPSPG
jgi:hypothetical protein